MADAHHHLWDTTTWRHAWLDHLPEPFGPGRLMLPRTGRLHARREHHEVMAVAALHPRLAELGTRPDSRPHGRQAPY